ncbi:2-keto-4-pentenoate hydratase [Nocardioides sp. Kera G14]|uniref:2-keto-4-pentenoate hydratase n=1 Tax=Nocardioides sp. Kera G14 TaxID=2884264 RepID=UPI001D1275CF|nr:fumarylacetoacetate hydrolase family protein [Nocardioides sp. Kera G14]UDY23412.1 hypothetical protein LH076_15325 [Nocardioides sp. Kera G14]
MNLPSADLAAIAAKLGQAELSATPVEQVAEAAGLSLSEAYAIQLLGVQLRRKRGERVTGLKLGFTSREKALQMGVSDVILGFLTDRMELAPGAVLELEGLLHPRVEPEVAFLIDPRAGEIDPTDIGVDLLEHVTHVAPAMEVIDSRFRNFSFSLEDVVADNTSACRYVVGQWRPLAELCRHSDLAALDVQLKIDGAIATSGSTGAILGDPLHAPSAVRRLAAVHGHPLTGGAILLAGAATPDVALEPGTTVVAEIEQLGEVSLQTAP